MDAAAKRTPLFFLSRFSIYAFLIIFGFLMLFPFIYMLATSFKLSTDVFRSPPMILPQSPVTVEFNGEQRSVYLFKFGDQTRRLVLTGEKVSYLSFTTVELLNPDAERSSELIVQYPEADTAKATPTGNEVTLKRSNGREKAYPEYEVEINGQKMKLLLAYKGALDEFVDPADPSFLHYASARTAIADEFVDFQLSNYSTVLGQNPDVKLTLDRSLINTIMVTLGVVVGQLITSIFGGYAFARINFKGRNTLFVAYLGSIMIPFVVLIIPMYRLMVMIGWQNKLVSLIVPWIFTAYGTFLMRQFFLGIPKELEEAALIDGLSRFGILWKIFVPLSTPAIATLMVFSFLYAWNSFLWPLLIIGEGNEPNHVLTLSMIRLSNAFSDKPNLVLTGAAIAILPPIILFILAQRYFIESSAASGMK
jgi:ABC-type glycerol-3-phosphate transport system permease component